MVGRLWSELEVKAVQLCEPLNSTHLCTLKSREGYSVNFISIKNKVDQETAEGCGLWDSPVTLAYSAVLGPKPLWYRLRAEVCCGVW